MKMTSLCDIPHTAIHHIFNLLPQKSKVNLSLTSKYFQITFDEMYGKVVYLGEPTLSKRIRPLLQEDQIDIIENSRVRICLVGKLLDPIKSSKGICRLFYTLRNFLTGNNQPISFKYPHLLQKLNFQARISPNYFVGLTTTVFNVTSLSFHWKALSSLNSDVLDPLYFPNLISLDIWGGHDIKDGGNINTKKLCDFIGNVSIVLKNVFLSLRVFRMDLPNEFRILKLLTRFLLTFLERHASTLFIFKLELISIPKFPRCKKSPFVDIQDKFLNMNEISSNLNLKTLEFISYDFDIQKNGFSYFDNWTEFVLKQRCLKEFQGVGMYLKPEVVTNIILNNASNLHLLHLCLRTKDFGSWTPFDCSILSSCTLLNDLALEGLTQKRKEGQPGIINVSALPKSLKTLSIKRLPVATFSIEQMCCKMHNLQHLRLIEIDCGHGRESGVTAHTLKYIIQSQHLKVFAISCESILYNENKPDESIQSIFRMMSSTGNKSRPEVKLNDLSGKLLELFLRDSKYYYEIL